MYQYFAHIIRWVDGDTVWLDLDLGFRAHIQVDVRLSDVNAPDVVNFDLKGLNDRAREYCELMLPPGAALVADISRPDKYGRWLASVRYLQGSADWEKILSEGKILNAELVQRGLAQPYHGGKK